MAGRIYISLSSTLVLAAGSILLACGGRDDGGRASEAPPSEPTRPETPPGALSYPTPQRLPVNVAMTAIAPVTTGALTNYRVAPALPRGITLDASTGVISGAPTATAPAKQYTISATSSGRTVGASLSLAVFGLDLVSGGIVRTAAQGSAIYPEVTLQAQDVDPDGWFVTASDASGLFLAPVTVTTNPDGTLALGLATDRSVPANLFTGTVSLRFCRDAACTRPEERLTVAVPISVRVLAPLSTWPGDTPTALSGWPAAPDWSTTQGNPAHTGFVPVTTAPDQFTLRWRTAGNPTWTIYGQGKQNLVTSNGMFYVVSSQYLDGGVVYGRSESDAHAVWSFDLAGLRYPSANPAAVANGVVYFAAGHQDETYLFARNASDGSPVFQSKMLSQWEGYYAPTVGPNGVIYANGGMYGGIYAFNPLGGQLFFSSLSQVSSWTPAVDATGVYTYTGDTLKVVSLTTGAAAVSIQDPLFQNYVYDAGGAPVLGNSALGSVFGAAYTNALLNDGSLGNYLTNFRTTTGSIAWQIPGVYPTTPGYSDGVVYAVNQTPRRLEARAELDGSLLWSWAPDYANDSLFVSEVLLTKNLAFVSTKYATHAIDLRTHRSVWSYPGSGKLALSANGVLYIHSATSLVAVNLK